MVGNPLRAEGRQDVDFDRERYRSRWQAFTTAILTCIVAARRHQPYEDPLDRDRLDCIRDTASGAVVATSYARNPAHGRWQTELHRAAAAHRRWPVRPHGSVGHAPRYGGSQYGGP